MNLMTIVLQASEGGGGGTMQFLLLLGAMFVVMYFFMIRPQQKRQKELNNFRNTLAKGQKVITAGGIYGTIKEIKEQYILIEVDNNVSIRVDKSMIMRDNTDVQNTAK